MRMARNHKTSKKGDLNEIPAAPEKPNEPEAVTIARTVLQPAVQAAVTLKDYDKSYGDLDLSGLIDALKEQTKASRDGDLTRAEAMLTAQAHTLDAIFNNLARQAINAGYLDKLSGYLKLALRAQSQCRATWETLATIQNPPLVGYVRQANIAHGPQQVNNASAAPDNTSDNASRARENPNLQTKLLEKTDGERLDPRTTGTPGRARPSVATVGEIDGTEDRRR